MKAMFRTIGLVLAAIVAVPAGIILLGGIHLFVLINFIERYRPIAEEIADVRRIIDRNGGPEELNRQVAEFFRALHKEPDSIEARCAAEKIPALQGIGRCISYFGQGIEMPGALIYPERIRIRRGGHFNTVFIHVLDPDKDYRPDPDLYLEVCRNVYIWNYAFYWDQKGQQSSLPQKTR